MEEFKKLDLWGNVLDNSNNAESVITLLEEQASLLEEKTEGKVKAKFVKIEYTYSGNNMTALKSLAGAMRAIAPLYSKQEVIDDKLEDANISYKMDDYKFEIYNDKYKYRLFTLKFRSVFPLTILLEPGILEGENNEIKIMGQQDMEKILRKILMSEKIRFVIQQLSKEDSIKK